MRWKKLRKNSQTKPAHKGVHLASRCKTKRTTKLPRFFIHSERSYEHVSVNQYKSVTFSGWNALTVTARTESYVSYWFSVNQCGDDISIIDERSEKKTQDGTNMLEVSVLKNSIWEAHDFPLLTLLKWGRILYSSAPSRRGRPCPCTECRISPKSAPATHLEV